MNIRNVEEQFDFIQENFFGIIKDQNKGVDNE